MPRKPTKRETLTPSQEAFCKEYSLNGGNATAAYRKAFPKSKNSTDATIAVSASKLLKQGKIALRVQKLRTKVQEVAEKKFLVTAESLIQEMAAIAYGHAGDYFEWGTQTVKRRRKDGTEYEVEEPFMRFKDSAGLSHTQMKAVAGVEKSVSKTGDIVVNVKLHDKRAAIKDLHAMAGFAKPTEVSGVGGAPLQIVISRAEEAL